MDFSTSAVEVATTLLVPRQNNNSTYSSIRNYRDHCTLDTCPLSASYWDYRPSIAANSLFLALFSLSTLLFIAQGLYSRRFLGFSIAMVSGCALEIVGYIGRIMSYNNPFSENGFLIQIVCLTIAPAFLAAGIYFCLSRIVVTFGEQNSRIKGIWYPRIFIPCDVVSLLLQAAGGGIASARSHADQDPTLGNNLMIAGLAFQVITLFVFICLSMDFMFRTWRRIQRLGSAQALDPTHAKLRSSRKFQGFLVALAFATLCIFTRSVYRVAELSEGWNGHLIKTQKYFIGLEGAIVASAVLALNAFHPGLCFREGYVERGAFGMGKRKATVNGQRGEKLESVGSDEPVVEQTREI